MGVIIESDFQHRIIYQKFQDDSRLTSLAELDEWRKDLTSELENWHTPWRSLVDFTSLKAIDESLKEPLAQMFGWFKNLFLEEIAGFGMTPERGSDNFPFPVFATEEEAGTLLQIHHGHSDRRAEYRGLRVNSYPKEGFLELLADQPIVLSSDDDLTGVQRTISKYLLRFHTPWHLLIDLTNITFEAHALSHFAELRRAFTGLFLRDVIGFPRARAKKTTYPFALQPTRHEALVAISLQPTQRGSCTMSTAP